MTSTGYLQVSAYTSNALIPLKDVAITVTASDGTAIAMRLPDRSGKIQPIEIPVPAKAESQSPDPDERPYTLVNLYARLPGYYQIENESIQIFSGITTNQNLELIPLSELPELWSDKETFFTPAQNL